MTTNVAPTWYEPDPPTAWSRLGIDPTHRPAAWTVVGAVRAVGFSGEVTLGVVDERGLDRTARVYSSRGLVYWAERDGDPGVGEQLVRVGALTADEALSGTVQLGDTVHVGRLFGLLPDLDVDRVATAVEYLRDSVIGAIADLEVGRLGLAEHRHHPSGLVLWELDIDDLDERTADRPVPDSVQSAVQAAIAGIRAAIVGDRSPAEGSGRR